MNNHSKCRHGRVIFGLVALLSASFLTRAPFEKNPQDCELISVITPKKKNNLQK
jgi:hypothetical protein